MIIDYILRILQAKKIKFTSYDLASDEKAKLLWKRKGAGGNSILASSMNMNLIHTSDRQLPGILVGGSCPGVSLNVICH